MEVINKHENSMGDIVIEYCPTLEMIANIHTKPKSGRVFVSLWNKATGNCTVDRNDILEMIAAFLTKPKDGKVYLSLWNKATEKVLCHLLLFLMIMKIRNR
jgi:hypothetical protein